MLFSTYTYHSYHNTKHTIMGSPGIFQHLRPSVLDFIYDYRIFRCIVAVGANFVWSVPLYTGLDECCYIVRYYVHYYIMCI